MRKKIFTFCLPAAVILSGCGTKKAPALSGDFLFDLPGKYSEEDQQALLTGILPQKK